MGRRELFEQQAFKQDLGIIMDSFGFEACQILCPLTAKPCRLDI